MQNSTRHTNKLLRGLIVAGLALLTIVILLPERAESRVVVRTSRHAVKARGPAVSTQVRHLTKCACQCYEAPRPALRRRGPRRSQGASAVRFPSGLAPACCLAFHAGASFCGHDDTRPVVRRPRPAHGRHEWVPGHWVKVRGRSRVWVSGHWHRA